MSIRKQNGNVNRNEAAKANVAPASGSAKYQKPQVIPVASAVELVQGGTYGNGPDGYTGYYKYH